MAIHDIRLLALDIDGTLFACDEQISANTRQAIGEAGIGVAMGNAISELKDRADFISKSNDEDGIVHALQHYGLL